MPDYYTHAYVASQALMRSGKVVASHPAFIAGANGPDSLYAYQTWKKKKTPDLPRLAKRLHQEKTGAFLAALAQLAITSVQQSYVLGFLTHYASDCIMHPYVRAMSESGAPYAGKQGASQLQASIDSHLYYQDYKTRLVPLHAGTPVLITDELAQVTNLLHDAIYQVYGTDVPVVALADAFHDNLTYRKFLISRYGVKKFFAPMLEHILLGKKSKGKLRSRMQPAPPLKALPEKWKNPYTQEELDVTLDEMLVLSQQAGAACIMATMDYWLGVIEAKQLSDVIGDNNYYTGLPNGTVELLQTAQLAAM